MMDETAMRSSIRCRSSSPGLYFRVLQCPILNAVRKRCLPACSDNRANLAGSHRHDFAETNQAVFLVQAKRRDKTAYNYSAYISKKSRGSITPKSACCCEDRRHSVIANEIHILLGLTCKQKIAPVTTVPPNGFIQIV